MIGMADRHEIGRLERNSGMIGEPELVVHMCALGRHTMREQHLAP
jgi:hypothetical protein